MHTYGKCGIEYNKVGFSFSIRAEGLLTCNNKPLDSNTTVAYYVTRRELDRWLTKKGITKPSFGPAEYLYRD
jgi:hypothetical protein